MEAFKEKAKIVMHTFNINPTSSKKGDSIAFLANRSVNINISNVAAAFPLVPEGDQNRTQQMESGTHTSFPVRAFLFYVKLFKFETHRGETGKAIMDGFSFQFVPRYVPR